MGRVLNGVQTQLLALAALQYRGLSEAFGPYWRGISNIEWGMASRFFFGKRFGLVLRP